ncbi:MAG TPA: hypothetical protein ENL05_01095 [Candidatus Moranbacteria bacterium]|nr:hypothetical protein [Candidatus Moranbacteria bacterium]
MKKKMSEMQVGEMFVLVDPSESGIGIFKVITRTTATAHAVAKGMVIVLDSIADNFPEIITGETIKVPFNTLVCPLKSLP